MYSRVVVCILLGALMVRAQTINLQGVVSDNTGKPVANASVTLVRQNLKVTTGSDGKYSFIKTHIAEVAPVSKIENIFMENGVLQFSLNGASPVRFEFYDISGKLLKREVLKNNGAGVYHYNVQKQLNASNLMIIKAVIGSREMSIPYMTLKNGKYLQSTLTKQSGNVGSLSLTAAATIDTIKVSATGYQLKSVAITSYENQQQNITLDPVSNNGKNPPGPSTGCGKPLSALKTGTWKITSSGSQREYTINIPANYDPNKPYRLIYCSHWIWSSDDDVSTGRTVKSTPAGRWAYYGLKQIADSVGEPCIFIAPQSATGTWDQKDHVLLDDILKLVKGELCVDTTRIFATGFSFGAMITYSFSLNHQKDLRAVCCLAAANYNIYLPANTRQKIAYMGVVGMSDEMCPPTAGRACRDTHVTDNGCSKPTTVPETTNGSKSHVVYDYQGCAEGYPVKWCTFDGAHIAAPYDGGGGDDGNKTWIPKETWKFFSQF